MAELKVAKLSNSKTKRKGKGFIKKKSDVSSEVKSSDEVITNASEIKEPFNETSVRTETVPVNKPVSKPAPRRMTLEQVETLKDDLVTLHDDIFYLGNTNRGHPLEFCKLVQDLIDKYANNYLPDVGETMKQLAILRDKIYGHYHQVVRAMPVQYMNEIKIILRDLTERTRNYA